MYKHTTAHSKEFFDALRKASVEIMDYYGLPTNPGVKRKTWKHGRPIGVTEHFTAGVTWKGAIRWLNGQDNMKSSCCAMILDRRIGEVDSITSKYPILDVLPVTVIMMADLAQGTWNCGWGNAYNWGIENRNAGPLRGQQGAWTWWPNNYQKSFPHEKLGKTPVNVDGRWWEPYTYGQVVANILVCQYLHCLYQEDGGLNPSWFLPHSALSSRKWDTGRAYPLQGVRDAVFDQTEIENLIWLHDFKNDPVYMDDYEEEWDHDFLVQLAQRQQDRYDEEVGEEQITVLEMPDADLEDLIEDGHWRTELNAVRRGLTKLGYYVGSEGPDLDETTALAVWQFQKSMKLTVDKIPGNKTQTAMYKRLKDFQLEK
jgi:hypothetical protein